jgi:hypothetical protein
MNSAVSETSIALRHHRSTIVGASYPRFHAKLHMGTCNPGPPLILT